MAAATPETLEKFVNFCKQHITGQERKQAQTFLDRFFRAFGHEGALEAGASYEEAIKKGSKQGKTGFADLVWKPRVLIEMKKRGEDLSKHYSQAFDYWTRLAALEYIVHHNGYIHDAISSQAWSGEASVHVSIINWCKKKPVKFYLDNCLVTNINPSLQSTIDVTLAHRLKANIGYCIRGVEPNGHGFIVTEEQLKSWVTKDAKNQEVLKLFSMGANLAKNPHGTPERWIIDFVDMSLEEASNYILPFRHIETFVKPERLKNREKNLQQKWWRFKRTNEAMRKSIASLNCYFTVPRVSKWAVFIPAPINWLAGDKSVVLTTDDFYIFGIVSSKVHRIWMNAQKSTLGETTAYTPTTCFETFPFPQTPTAKLVQQIRSQAEELHQYRTEQMESKQWGITTLYNKFFDEPTSLLYKLHEQLDKLVMQAYNFYPQDDILEKLLQLNLHLAEKEKQGINIIGPWTPK